MGFAFLMLMVCFCGIVATLNSQTKEQRIKKAREVGRQTAAKKVKVRKRKDTN